LQGRPGAQIRAELLLILQVADISGNQLRNCREEGREEGRELGITDGAISAKTGRLS
jgi:hypothetical protein